MPGRSDEQGVRQVCRNSVSFDNCNRMCNEGYGCERVKIDKGRPELFGRNRLRNFAWRDFTYKLVSR